MRTLSQRILDLVPALDYGLETFLGLVCIVETTDVPTAAMPLGGRPRLLINPDFVASSCRSDDDLLALVLHELHHVLLGHTRLFERISPVANIAFDAVINAMVCRRRPACAGFFQRLYEPSTAPELLLRPPDGWPGSPRLEGVDPRWQACLDNLYYRGSGTFSEVFELLVGEIDATEHGPRLLGNHGDDVRGLQGTDDPLLFEVVRGIVERWPQPADPRVGRSINAVLDEHRVAMPRVPPDRILRRALLSAARVGRGARGAMERSPEVVQQAWPSRDRRAFALQANGGQPLLYRAVGPGRPRRANLSPVDVYVDVSGSVGGYVSALFAAIRGCGQLVAPTVFQFSDRVQEVSLSDLARGLVRTSGGTSGEALTAHLAQRGKAAVVITDGYVGPIPDGHLAACRRARLQVVLTPGGWLNDLAPAAAAIHHLEMP